MAGGYTKAIEGVRPGDMVKSYDETTGEIENKCVLSTTEIKCMNKGAAMKLENILE